MNRKMIFAASTAIIAMSASTHPARALLPECQPPVTVCDVGATDCPTDQVAFCNAINPDPADCVFETVTDCGTTSCEGGIHHNMAGLSVTCEFTPIIP
jgi:hypothetical protein